MNGMECLNLKLPIEKKNQWQKEQSKEAVISRPFLTKERNTVLLYHANDIGNENSIIY